MVAGKWLGFDMRTFAGSAFFDRSVLGLLPVGLFDRSIGVKVMQECWPMLAKPNKLLPLVGEVR